MNRDLPPPESTAPTKSLRRRGSVWRWWGSFLLGALVGGAAEDAHRPAGRESPRTLDATREELRQLKSGPDPTPAPAGALPRLSAPEWHGGPTPPRPAAPARLNPTSGAARPNWLLDAMQQPEAGRGLPRDRDRTRGERIPDLEAREVGPELATGKPAESRATERDSGKKTEPETQDRAASAVHNPLHAFLEGWMTPQDYALLQAPSSREGGPLLPGTAEAMTSARGEAFAPAVSLARGSDPLLPARLPATRQEPRENPFLAGLNAPVAASAPVPPPSAAAPGAPPAMAPPTPAPAPAPASRVPDFVRPNADEKYFKPLKRF